MEPPNSGTLCSAASPTPHPQHLFNGVVASDVFNGIQGWPAEPLTDPHQGNAPRRIRLAHSIQRASVTEPVLTSDVEDEDEPGICYSADSSSASNTEDYANVFSQTMVRLYLLITPFADASTNWINMVLTRLEKQCVFNVEG
jgi:hypothetical protein